MVKTKEEIMNSLKSVIGDNSSDDVLVLLEDVDDTLSVSNDPEDWKGKYEQSNEEWRTKYEELDDTWRKKYRDRFYGDVDDTEDKIFEDVFEGKEEQKPVKYDDLFKEE